MKKIIVNTNQLININISQKNNLRTYNLENETLNCKFSDYHCEIKMSDYLSQNPNNNSEKLGRDSKKFEISDQYKFIISELDNYIQDRFDKFTTKFNDNDPSYENYQLYFSISFKNILASGSIQHQKDRHIIDDHITQYNPKIRKNNSLHRFRPYYYNTGSANYVSYWTSKKQSKYYRYTYNNKKYVKSPYSGETSNFIIQIPLFVVKSGIPAIQNEFIISKQQILQVFLNNSLQGTETSLSYNNANSYYSKLILGKSISRNKNPKYKLGNLFSMIEKNYRYLQFIPCVHHKYGRKVKTKSKFYKFYFPIS